MILQQKHSTFPELNILYLTQNATIASPVFQVIANDPDNSATPSGMLTYKIQDDIEDATAFKIGKISIFYTMLYDKLKYKYYAFNCRRCDDRINHNSETIGPRNKIVL